jgi:hypothetical protein
MLSSNDLPPTTSSFTFDFDGGRALKSRAARADGGVASKGFWGEAGGWA